MPTTDIDPTFDPLAGVFPQSSLTDAGALPDPDQAPRDLGLDQETHS